MIKKGVALLLALMMCLSVLAACAPGEKGKQPGAGPGGNTPAEGNDLRITCTYDMDTGVLTLSGSGALDRSAVEPLYHVALAEDLLGQPIVFTDVLNYFDEYYVVIEEGITEIDGGIFERAGGVSIPKTVTKIGRSAFQSAKFLTSVELPESITEIGDYAFYNSSIRSITIPESITKVGKEAFKKCANLKEVTILSDMAEFGEGLFNSCQSLITVTMAGNVAEIAPYAFSYCESLRSVTLPQSVTKIGNSAFTGCNSLTSFIIPDGVTEIGEYAFAYCEGLTDVTIPQSVVKIAKGAFTSCALSSVTILNPNAVIEDGAFDADVAVGR